MFLAFNIDIHDKQKELTEMEPTDYVITNDEKLFLEEQLKPKFNLLFTINYSL